MPDTITSMRVFISAVRLGSFAAAAEKMDMSPQMVARHIASLESRLNARLLNRTTRKQSLTAVGRDYYPRCLRILADIDDAERCASNHSDVLSGTLRLNAPVTFGRYALMPFMTEFLARYSGVKAEVILSDAWSDPEADGFDVVIRIGEPDKNLRQIALPLPAYQLIVCAAPAYLRQAGTPTRPEELSQYECLGFSPWRAGLTNRWVFVKDQEQIIVEVASRLTVNDWSALFSAALSGTGIVLGYDKAMAKALDRGELVQILPDYTFPNRPLHALFSPTQRHESKTRVFIDAFTHYLAEN
ncbi:LysR family transcriptional regulator [Lonsdalea britannica]|uniref:LysR family transcriptional regulator n=1 Tax=Lonsdalea britannica TaxID=1082704 RepID=UPI0026F039A7|nr:LysR family transcriptional regulator [Lonsdalea britannica]